MEIIIYLCYSLLNEAKRIQKQTWIGGYPLAKISAAERRAILMYETRSPVRNINWLAWPIFLENLLMTLVSYADTAMVGSLGAYATASVSISNSVVFLLNGVVMSLGVGVTALISQSIGAEDLALTKKLTRHAVLILIF